MNIWICEEDQKVTDTLMRVIKQWRESTGTHTTVRTFQYTADLFNGAKLPEIIFIDTKQSGTNGFEVAAKLRRLLI